jgi:hypothetical protein
LVGCEDNINTFQLNEELKKTNQSVWVGREFKLKVGEEVFLRKENLKIKFVSVPEDSRCPINVDCFWSGNARVALTYQKNLNQSVNDTLNTNLQPHVSRYLRYRIILKDLEPYPTSTGPLPPDEEEYIATILVKKIMNSSKHFINEVW